MLSFQFQNSNALQEVQRLEAKLVQLAKIQIDQVILILTKNS
jgi:hypothetical protein